MIKINFKHWCKFHLCHYGCTLWASLEQSLLIIHGSISLCQSLESPAFWSTRRGLMPSSKFSLHCWAEIEFYFPSVLILIAAGCCYNSDLFLIFKKDNTNESLNTSNCLHYFIYFFILLLLFALLLISRCIPENIQIGSPCQNCS